MSSPTPSRIAITESVLERIHARVADCVWTEMPRGGHFAAMERPDLLIEDIRAFARTFR